MAQDKYKRETLRNTDGTNVYCSIIYNLTSVINICRISFHFSISCVSEKTRGLCMIGYNDFNFGQEFTIRKMPNKILRYIWKIRYTTLTSRTNLLSWLQKLILYISANLKICTCGSKSQNLCWFVLRRKNYHEFQK